jgi:colanic acid/amylovoran biosynthesis glycosyltransferase
MQRNNDSSLPIRVGISVIQFPAASETFIVTKVLGLLDAGFDVQIFVSRQSSTWDKFAVLQDREDVRERIHIAPPADSLVDAVFKGLPQFILTALRHPLAFGRYVRHCWRNRKRHPLGFLKALYSRVHFVGQALDILHIEFDTQALSQADIKEYLNCKLLLSSRGTFQKTTVLDKYPQALPYLFNYVDGYHFISEYLRQNMRRLGLPDSVPTWLIEPAVNLELFTVTSERTSSEDKPLRLITVARIVWQKGHEFAVDAVARVHDAGVPVEYWIVGDGNYEETVRFAVHQHGLLEAGIVKFCGAVSREAVIEFLRQADVMIHAALEEGFCNAVIEGQASGLPVVVSDAGGLPENVEDGVTGFVVPRRDPDAMAARIIQLARDPGLRQQMGQAGRERALRKYDLREQVNSFAALYRELVSS